MRKQPSRMTKDQVKTYFYLQGEALNQFIDLHYPRAKLSYSGVEEALRDHRQDPKASCQLSPPALSQEMFCSTENQPEGRRTYQHPVALHHADTTPVSAGRSLRHQ